MWRRFVLYIKKVFNVILTVVAFPGLMVIAGVVSLVDWRANKRAREAAIAHCLSNGIEFGSIKVHKNHYTLMFSIGSSKGVVRFRVGPDKVVNWVGKIPEEFKNYF